MWKQWIIDEKRIANLNNQVQIHVKNICVEQLEEEEEDDDLWEEELLAQMGHAKPEPERKIRKPERRNLNEEVMGTWDELPRHISVTTSYQWRI